MVTVSPTAFSSSRPSTCTVCGRHWLGVNSSSPDATQSALPGGATATAAASPLAIATVTVPLDGTRLSPTLYSSFSSNVFSPMRRVSGTTITRTGFAAVPLTSDTGPAFVALSDAAFAATVTVTSPVPATVTASV